MSWGHLRSLAPATAVPPPWAASWRLSSPCSGGWPAAPLGRGGDHTRGHCSPGGGLRQTCPRCSPAAPRSCRGCPQPSGPALLLSALRTSLPKTFSQPASPRSCYSPLTSVVSSDSNTPRVGPSCAGHSHVRPCLWSLPCV